MSARASRQRPAVHVHVSASTSAVLVPSHGVELLRGRERFFLDWREWLRLLELAGTEG